MPDPTLSDLFQAIAAKARAAQQQAGPALQQFGGAVRQEAGDAAAGWLRSGADTFDHVGAMMTGGHPAQSAQNIYGTSSTPTLADRMRAWAPQAEAWGQQGAPAAPQGMMQRVMAAAGHAVGGAGMATVAAAPGLVGMQPGRAMPRLPVPALSTENVAASSMPTVRPDIPHARPLYSGQPSIRQSTTPPDVLYHVVGDAWQPGDPLVARDRMPDFGAPQPAWHWDEAEEGHDTHLVSLHDNVKDAHDYQQAFGGRIVEVRPDYAALADKRFTVNMPRLDGSGAVQISPRMQVNAEDYWAIRHAVPAEWVRPHTPPAP